MDTDGGNVLSIQRYCLHDGPGIRTTVFFQGCPLRCWWCHNPESQPLEPRLAIDASRCVRCGACAEACPEAGAGLPHVAERCQACGCCVAVCPTAGRELPGGRRTTSEVLAEVLADRDYFAESGGGVTFSGGEPLLQPEFLMALLRGGRALGLHTAVDTCGFAPWETLAAVAELADLILYDVKTVDDTAHREHVGAGNRPILENLIRLADLHPAIWIRVPVVPGVNDSVSSLLAIADFLRPLAVRRVDLLPYHPLGEAKRPGGGAAPSVEPPPAERMAELADALRARLPDVPVRAG